MFEGMHPFTRTRTAPTGYEKVRLIFHGIRCAQLISSIIVGSILIYFAWWLTHDRLHVPWTFIVLLVSCFITILILTVTLCLHCLTGLNPRLNLVFNSTMLFFWALGLAMDSYWTWGTLAHECSLAVWQQEEGVMVCRCYKALFTFALAGFLSTCAALVLDIHIHRLATRFGNHMRLDNIDNKPRTVVDARGPYADNRNARSADDLDEFPSRHSDAFEVPSAGYGANPSSQQKPLMTYGNDNAFEHDTGYYGGHEERAQGIAK